MDKSCKCVICINKVRLIALAKKIAAKLGPMEPMEKCKDVILSSIPDELKGDIQVLIVLGTLVTRLSPMFTQAPDDVMWEDARRVAAQKKDALENLLFNVTPMSQLLDSLPEDSDDDPLLMSGHKGMDC